jgi:hypothetical protein
MPGRRAQLARERVQQRRARAEAASLCVYCYVVPVTRWKHCLGCRRVLAARQKVRDRRRREETRVA